MTTSPDDLLAAHVATIPAYRAWIAQMRTARQKLLAQGRSRDEPATPAPGPKPPAPHATPPSGAAVDPAVAAVVAAALGEETSVVELAPASPATPLVEAGVASAEATPPSVSAAPTPETPAAVTPPDDPAARLMARFKGLEPVAPTPAAPPAAPPLDKPLDAATLRGIYGDKEG